MLISDDKITEIIEELKEKLNCVQLSVSYLDKDTGEIETFGACSDRGLLDLMQGPINTAVKRGMRQSVMQIIAELALTSEA